MPAERLNPLGTPPWDHPDADPLADVRAWWEMLRDDPRPPPYARDTDRPPG